MNNTDARNKGHGHVTPRPDGYRSRCGGPAICVVCQAERAAFEAATQPPQDERGQGRIPFAGHDPKFCPGSNPDNPQTEEDAEPAQPVNQGDEMNSNISEDYDRIDRYLRNNLGDDDYASYSASLDAVLAEGAQPTAQPMPKNWIESPTLDWLRKVLTRNDDNVSSASAEQIVNMIDHYAAASWNAAPPPHVDPDWENRNTESLSGWINELATLADHPQVREIWIRQAMGVIVRGLNRFAEPAQPVALSTLTEICQRCKGSGVVDDGEINCFEDGTPFENGPVKCVKDCPACAASTPSAVATPSPEALVEQYLADLISRSPDPLRELGDYLGRMLDEDEFPTAERYVLAAMKASLATPPQPVAAEMAKQARFEALEEAARLVENYDTNGDIVGGWQDIFAIRIRALAGTGSDESKKGDLNV